MRDFNHTVNVLVKAYLNNELAHRSCTACAVGNIVAAALGTKPIPDKENTYNGFCNNEYENGAGQNWYDFHNYTVKESAQTIATGYSVKELADIEYAFENCDERMFMMAMNEKDLYFLKNNKPICQDDEWMFKGLMAVVDCLAEIHKVDLTQKESAKVLFVKS